MAVVASDWNNRMRDVVMKLSSKIPEVGTVVNIFVGFFWPENKVNIFESLKADITKLVKKEILDYELNLHKNEIEALKTIIERYKAAKIHEKGGFLTNWITEADKLSVIFRKSNNNIHLILLVITLALLHLAGLRERLDFGKDIYQEDNTKQWKADLEAMYKTYIVKFLPDIFKKWTVWRAEQVKINAWTKLSGPLLYDSYATVEDTITGEKKSFFVGSHNSTTVFANICQDHKTRMCNDANADMAGCISTTFVFDKILPDNNNNLPKYDKNVFSRVFRGPYSEDLFYPDRKFNFYRDVPTFRSRPNRDDYASNSGAITKVIIREWNTVDAMQLMYANRQGSVAGNPRGGYRNEVNVMGKAIGGLRMGFSNGLLTYVQIKYCDGSSSSTYGNRGGWKCVEESPKAPTAYKLSSWSYKEDRGPSNTYGPSVVQLEYAPQIE